MAATVAANKAVNAVASSLKNRSFWTRPSFQRAAAGALAGYMTSGSIFGAITGGFGGYFAGRSEYGRGASRWLTKGLNKWGVTGQWGSRAGRVGMGLGVGAGIGLGWNVGGNIVSTVGTTFNSTMNNIPSQVTPIGYRY